MQWFYIQFYDLHYFSLTLCFTFPYFVLELTPSHLHALLYSVSVTFILVLRPFDLTLLPYPCRSDLILRPIHRPAAHVTPSHASLHARSGEGHCH